MMQRMRKSKSFMSMLLVSSLVLTSWGRPILLRAEAPVSRDVVGLVGALGTPDPSPPALPKALVLPETPIVAGAGVGYVPSSWGVGSSGQLSYTIPLDVPAGRAGMAPELSLAYASAGGNGPLGMGWAVTGAWSRIVRCGQSLSTDGVKTGVTFDKANDRFCLDGQELVAVGSEQGASGAYGESGTEYRTETDTFAQIGSVGSAATSASGPDAFVVLTKDGKTRRYTPRTAIRVVSGIGRSNFGAPPSTPPAYATYFQSSASVRALWLLERVTDRSGNEIRYDYQDFSDARGMEFQPWRITYTWGTGGVTGQRRVEFVYGQGDRADVAVEFQAGVAYKRAKLLQSIAMYAPNPASSQLVWEYRLTYAASRSTKRSLLASVAKCGPSTTCLKAKQFSYDDTVAVPTFTPVDVGPGPLDVTGKPAPAMQVADFDGDGADDILYHGGGGNKPLVRLGQRVGSGTALPLQQEFSALGPDFPSSTALRDGRPVDAQGDGRVEFMAQYRGTDDELHDKILVWDTTLHRFVKATEPGNPLRDGWSNFGDVDGDGLLDYLSIMDNAGHIGLRRWSIGLGGPWGPAMLAGVAAASDCPSSMADIDGDGRAELLAYKAGPASATCDDKGLYAWSFNGVSLSARPLFVENTSVKAFLATNATYRRGDFNGDGLVDTWWGDRVGWNTGAGLHLAAPHMTNMVTGCDNLAADMNGDGRDDLVSFDATGIWVSVSYGDGTFAPPVQIAANAGTKVDVVGPIQPFGACSYSTTKLGDFNADGRLDIVRIVDGQMSVLLQQATSFQDRLVTVRDEDVPWARETITYANTWSDHMEKIFDAPHCTYPQVCQRRGLPVVRKVASRAHNADVTTAANATAREMYYSYEDPVSELRGRGFLGFGTMRVWDPAQPRETVTTYAHRKQVDGKYYPEVGAASVVTTAVPIVTTTKTGTSSETARIIRTSYTHTTVKTHELNGRTTYTVQPTASTTLEWEQPVTVRWGGAGLGTTDPTEHVAGIAEPAADAALRIVRVIAQFDGFGNVTQHKQLTFGPGMEFPLVAEQMDMTYDNRLITAAHDGPDWLIGLLTQTKVTRLDTAHGVQTVTRTTDFTYDDLGRLQKVEVEKASPNPDVRHTTTYGYDALGVQNRVTTVAGDPAAPSLPPQETHVEYAPVFPGQPDERMYPSQIWQQHVPATLRSSTWLATHPGYGVTVASMDVNGVSTQSTFDAFGRLLSVQRDGQAKVTYRYAGRPDTAGGITGMIVTTTSASITTKSFTDVLGRSLQATRTGFDGTTTTVAKTSYDLLGRVQTSTAAAPGGTTTSAYDSLGRLVTTTLPDGQLVTSSHTFDTTTTVDPAGQQHTLTLDVAGRTIASTDVDKHADGSASSLTTHYEYAPFDLPAKIIDAKGHTTSMEYDVRGRRTKLTEPDRGVTETTFHGTGQIRTTRSPAANLSSTFTYDDMGRTIARVDDNGTTALTTSYTFDTAPHGIGALASATSPDGITTAFRYDSAGRRTGTDVTDQRPQITFSIDNDYDSAGRLTSIHYPDTGNGRLLLQYDYLSNGYLNALRYVAPGTSQVLDLVTIQSRHPNLALDTATLANGVTLTRSYDTLTGRLHTLTATTATGTTLQHLTYGYYANGLVKTRTQNDSQAVRNEAFHYDTLGRLTGWDLIPPTNDQTNTIYTYDTLGNLTATNNDHGLNRAFTYGKPDGSQPHTLTGVTAPCPAGQTCRNDIPQYDAIGRQVSGNGRTVTYTAFDLPRTVTRRGQTTTFAYDAFGQRIKKTNGTDITYTVGGLYEKRMSGTTVKHLHHLASPDGRIAQAVSDGTTTDIQYHLTDILGSITTTLATTGTPTGSFYFQPFGQRITADGTPFTAPTGDTQHGFTGHEHDDPLDLINMKGRIYDPTQDQFLTPDPILVSALNGQYPNPYSYVSNSPLTYTDPTGYITCAFVRQGACEEPGSGAGATGGLPALHGDGYGWMGAQQDAWFASPAVGDNCGGCLENARDLWRQAALAELQAYRKKREQIRLDRARRIASARSQSARNTTAATSDAGGMLRPAGEDLRLADNSDVVITVGASATFAPGVSVGGTIGGGIYVDISNADVGLYGNAGPAVGIGISAGPEGNLYSVEGAQKASDVLDGPAVAGIISTPYGTATINGVTDGTTSHLTGGGIGTPGLGVIATRPTGITTPGIVETAINIGNKILRLAGLQGCSGKGC